MVADRRGELVGLLQIPGRGSLLKAFKSDGRGELVQERSVVFDVAAATLMRHNSGFGQEAICERIVCWQTKRYMC
jgi:hypothetical protein